MVSQSKLPPPSRRRRYGTHIDACNSLSCVDLIALLESNIYQKKMKCWGERRNTPSTQCCGSNQNGSLPWLPFIKHTHTHTRRCNHRCPMSHLFWPYKAPCKFKTTIWRINRPSQVEKATMTITGKWFPCKGSLPVRKHRYRPGEALIVKSHQSLSQVLSFWNSLFCASIISYFVALINNILSAFERFYLLSLRCHETNPYLHYLWIMHTSPVHINWIMQN